MTRSHEEDLDESDDLVNERELYEALKDVVFVDLEEGTDEAYSRGRNNCRWQLSQTDAGVRGRVIHPGSKAPHVSREWAWPSMMQGPDGQHIGIASNLGEAVELVTEWAKANGYFADPEEVGKEERWERQAALTLIEKLRKARVPVEEWDGKCVWADTHVEVVRAWGPPRLRLQGPNGEAIETRNMAKIAKSMDDYEQEAYAAVVRWRDAQRSKEVEAVKPKGEARAQAPAAPPVKAPKQQEQQPGRATHAPTEGPMATEKKKSEIPVVGPIVDAAVALSENERAQAIGHGFQMGFVGGALQDVVNQIVDALGPEYKPMAQTPVGQFMLLLAVTGSSEGFVKLATFFGLPLAPQEKIDLATKRAYNYVGFVGGSGGYQAMRELAIPIVKKFNETIEHIATVDVPGAGSGKGSGG